MKIVILYSGGLDSLVMKTMADKEYPDAEVHCVFYDIGQEYADKEKAALPSYVEQRSLPWLQGTEALGKMESHSGNIYIPGRNLVLATVAACQLLPDQIWMGALLGETHSAATDKNFEFLARTNQTLNYVLSPFLQSVEVRFPLAEAGFSKLTATKYALDNGIPPETLKATSSCLSGEPGNCGHCVVCLRRWGIFKQLGFSEEYNIHPLEVPENQRMIYEMLTGDYYDHHRKAEILPALTDEQISQIKERYENGAAES